MTAGFERAYGPMMCNDPEGPGWPAGASSGVILKVAGLALLALGLGGAKAIGFGETIHGVDGSSTEIWWGHVALYVAFGAFLMWASDR